jgi:hypothetical protein
MTLLTQREAATVLRLSERSLERMRVSGLGPKLCRTGRSIRYRQFLSSAPNQRSLGQGQPCNGHMRDVH